MTAEPTPATETPAVTSTALAVITQEDQAAIDRAARSAALAVECAARSAEVAAEQTTRQEAHTQADAAFRLEMDADVTELRRNGSPAYADGWLARIHAYCDEASDIIAAQCTRQKVAAA